MTSLNSTPFKAVRLGRPRAHEAGLVDERILVSATNLFMEQGFGRTTMDQVSSLSKVGKSTLYGRYPTKEDLFSAVVHRSIALVFTDLKLGPLTDSIVLRLRHVGYELARNMLLPRCVKLMRIIAAEGENFPALAEAAYQASSLKYIDAVTAALQPRDKANQTTNDIPSLARRFIELALQPVAFQAMMGGNYLDLVNKSLKDIDHTIELLVASGKISE